MDGSALPPETFREAQDVFFAETAYYRALDEIHAAARRAEEVRRACAEEMARLNAEAMRAFDEWCDVERRVSDQARDAVTVERVR